MRNLWTSTGSSWGAVRAVLAALGVALALQACGGGGGSGGGSNNGGGGTSTPAGGTTPIVTSGSNVVAVTVAQGPNPNAPNVPFVNVTVCAPGTSVCDTVTNVMVDTGSTGLRLLASSLPTSLASLGTNTSSSSGGSTINECGLFVSGYTWGSTRVADVKVGQEGASNQVVQVIADPSAGSVPVDCASAGSNTAINTATALGANGVLGLQGFLQDCGSACTNTSQPVGAAYYACGSGTCQAIGVPLAQQVGNTVAGFPTDNNGSILQLPSVGAAGAVSVSGSLVFGIGTQSNNALASAIQIPTDSDFAFSATYKGSVIGGSFVDSGSNFLFFTDSSLTQCSQPSLNGFYCPSSTTAESATLAPSTASSSTTTYPATFSIANAATVLAATSNFAFSNVGVYMDPNSGMGMDFGLPFFFGKNVYVGLEGAATSSNPSGTSGFVAFSSNGS